MLLSGVGLYWTYYYLSLPKLDYNQVTAALYYCTNVSSFYFIKN